MLEAARAAIRFVNGKNRADLETDELLLFAIIRAIEVLGEAASRVSAETRNELAAVPWSEMVGMRNRLIHGYFTINKDIVWQTATEELAPLEALLSDALGASTAD